jgi:hypothetical protein
LRGKAHKLRRNMAVQHARALFLIKNNRMRHYWRFLKFNFNIRTSTPKFHNAQQCPNAPFRRLSDENVLPRQSGTLPPCRFTIGKRGQEPRSCGKKPTRELNSQQQG